MSRNNAEHPSGGRKMTELQDCLGFFFFVFFYSAATISDPAPSLGGEEQDGGGGDKNPSEGVYLLSTPPERSIFLIWVQVIIFHITAPGSRVKWLIF